MNLFSPRILSLWLLSAGVVTAHAAVEPSCRPIVDALTARSNAPAENTITLMKPLGIEVEIIRYQGRSYTRTASSSKKDPWINAYGDHAEELKAMVNQVKSRQIGLSSCAMQPGGGQAEGVPVKILTFQLLTPGASKPMPGIIKIGQADGLPYVFNVGSNETRSRYTGIKAPKLGK